MPDLPHVCIVGAGASGLATAKALKERGIPFDCFEKSDRVGGLWVFQNKNGQSSAYRSLHANTSKSTMAFSDFPMRDEVPDFPHHSDVARYLEAYADHFGLRQHVVFETSVERAERRSNGLWEVETDRGETRLYDALVVAAGHHWDPRWPEPPFPGHFDGVEMHSHDFVDATPFAGNRVVVLGIGNSAMDIAVEASFVAERVFLATTRGAHIIPHYVFGRPMDSFKDNPRIPTQLRRLAADVALRLLFGRAERYGMPKPDHRWGQTAPTISSFILTRVAQEEVIPKPTIAAFEGRRVRFADGTSVEADVVIYSTGYRITFPFFDPGFLSAPEGHLPLFKRVFLPEVPGLFFAGLLQVWGAVPPLAEAQARLVAACLAGQYALPAKRAMLEDVARDERIRAKRYPIDAKRNAMLLDGAEYLLTLKREMRRGARRAKRQGGTLSIPPRARGPVAPRAGVAG
jgi:dimethylaniline monooxygenase (N-oxide forming)